MRPLNLAQKASKSAKGVLLLWLSATGGNFATLRLLLAADLRTFSAVKLKRANPLS